MGLIGFLALIQQWAQALDEEDLLECDHRDDSGRMVLAVREVL